MIAPFKVKHCEKRFKHFCSQSFSGDKSITILLWFSSLFVAFLSFLKTCNKPDRCTYVSTMFHHCAMSVCMCVWVCEVSIENSGLTQNESSGFPLRAWVTEVEWKTGFTHKHTHTHTHTHTSRSSIFYKTMLTYTHNKEHTAKKQQCKAQ